MTLYTSPEQHCANRAALRDPVGGVLQIRPGILVGHSEKAEVEDRSNVGLPVQVRGIFAFWGVREGGGGGMRRFDEVVRRDE